MQYPEKGFSRLKSVGSILNPSFTQHSDLLDWRNPQIFAFMKALITNRREFTVMHPLIVKRLNLACFFNHFAKLCGNAGKWIFRNLEFCRKFLEFREKSFSLAENSLS